VKVTVHGLYLLQILFAEKLNNMFSYLQLFYLLNFLCVSTVAVIYLTCTFSNELNICGVAEPVMYPINSFNSMSMEIATLAFKF